MKKLLIGSLLFLTACGPQQYINVNVYCPNAPILNIDSVYHIGRYKNAVYIDYFKNGQIYTSTNSPSCTVRTVKVYSVTK